MDAYRYLSMPIDTYRCLAIPIGTNPDLSMPVDTYQCIWICVDTFRYMSTGTDEFRRISMHIHTHRHISIQIDTYQPTQTFVPVDIYPFESSTLDLEYLCANTFTPGTRNARGASVQTQRCIQFPLMTNILLMDCNSHISFVILPNRPKLVHVLTINPGQCQAGIHLDC